MTLDQIIAAQEQASRVIRGIRFLVNDGPTVDTLNRAMQILEEVRNFAACWEQNRTAEEADTIHPLEAQRKRTALTDRLVTFVVPTRL